MEKGKEDNKKARTSTNSAGSAGGRKGGNRRSSSFGRPKPEFDQKIINIRRVTRVVAGGRRFSFSVALVAGDKKGSIGLGLGKAGDTALAINKAVRNAKKNMVRLKLTKTMSIPHELSAKFASSRVMLLPNKGRGLVAGSVVRDIVKLSGMKDITGKIVSNSKNKLNNAKAVMAALEPISSKHSKPLLDSVVIPVDPNIIEAVAPKISVEIES
ncbi:MAG: 30S ribosomal protein S5 [Candidatus Paceibacterota bacterium]